MSPELTYTDEAQNALEQFLSFWPLVSSSRWGLRSRASTLSQRTSPCYRVQIRRQRWLAKMRSSVSPPAVTAP